MKKRYLGIGILILVLVILILFNPGLGWKIRGFFEGRYRNQGVDELVLENQSLKSELLLLKNVRDSLPKWMADYVPAMVYSRYPFNLKDEILLGAGKNQNITGNEAVVLSVSQNADSLTSGGVLAGRIKTVMENTSLAATIFDPEWRSEVKIGDKGVEALLRGGVKPELALIKKEADVKDGDLVYSTDSRFLYGIPLGYLKEVRLAPDNLLKEADLDLSYDLGQVQALLILKKP
ncbi:MAG: rod shape-determining protein MreC [Patescibacteria group bacterium]